MPTLFSPSSAVFLLLGSIINFDLRATLKFAIILSVSTPKSSAVGVRCSSQNLFTTTPVLNNSRRWSWETNYTFLLLSFNEYIKLIRRCAQRSGIAWIAWFFFSTTVYLPFLSQRKLSRREKERENCNFFFALLFSDENIWNFFLLVLNHAIQTSTEIQECISSLRVSQSFLFNAIQTECVFGADRHWDCETCTQCASNVLAVRLINLLLGT